ncbi:MAG: hypothetical protein Q9219_006075 [cf. Caloplaca sp. 3 TL-2023]
MADIYKSAEKVIVWLGPAEDNSSLAMNSLEELASKFEVDRDTFELTPFKAEDADTIWLALDYPAPFTEAMYRVIICFLDRPWFSRLWILQEVLLGADRAQLVCGKQILSWLALRKAICCLLRRKNPKNFKGFESLVLRISEISSLQGDTSLLSLPLSSILEPTKIAQCSDPRDRVYAVLSLMREEDRLGLQPDYHKSVSDVFQDVVVKDFSIRGNASLLTHCEQKTEVHTMPSWVPDWSISKVCNSIKEATACGSSWLEAKVLDGNVLAITGIRATQIIARFPILPTGDAPLKEEFSSVRALIAFARVILCSPSRDKADEVICRTLFTNRFSDQYEPILDSAWDFPEAMTCFDRGGDEKISFSSQSIEDSATFAGMTRIYATGRMLIATDIGRSIGLAPKARRENDQIVVLLGCDSPLVGREIEAERYHVMGECYVHGLMKGEVLLGPLPDKWRQIYRYDETSQEYWRAFCSKRLGTLQIEDPRLSPLP